MFVDGSLGSRTAFLMEPYEDDPSNRGILLLSRDELTRLLARAAEQDLCLALDHLRTDHVDLFLLHGVGLKDAETNKQILDIGGSLEFLEEAKRQGLTRFIGMSVHAPHGSALALLDAYDGWDVIMPFLNYVSRAQEDTEVLLSKARDKGLGIVGMKVLGGYPGKLAEDYDRAFRYALSVEGVSSVLIGVRKPEEVARAVKAAREFEPMSPEEMEQTIEKGRQMARGASVEARVLTKHRTRGAIRLT